jgi:predicted negative regulator of RcsB-dependent stress response
VDVYTTEDQQVEALKRWWKENAKSILLGVALGLAAVFGWRMASIPAEPRRAHLGKVRPAHAVDTAG